MTNVVDISERLRMDETVRPFLTLLGAAPKVVDVLEGAFPNCSKDQQKALMAVVAWRIMGAQLPASVELLRRLPQMRGMHPETIQAAFMNLCEAGVLVFQQHGDEGSFVWPALDQIVFVALNEADTPKLVTPDGDRLR